MALWTVKHRRFAYDSYMKNNKSVTAVQQEFRRKFNIHQNKPVPTCNTILRWVYALHRRGTPNNKLDGAPRTVCAPENVEHVRPALLHSSNLSGHGHATGLGIDNHSVRGILREDLIGGQQMSGTDVQRVVEHVEKDVMVGKELE